MLCREFSVEDFGTLSEFKQQRTTFGADNKDNQREQDGARSSGKAEFSRKDSDNVSFSYKKKRTASYINNRLLVPTLSAIRNELKNLYGPLESGIADGIAIEHDKTIYIVDSGIDEGHVDFGVREKIIISDENLRKAKVENENGREKANQENEERISGRRDALHNNREAGANISVSFNDGRSESLRTITSKEKSKQISEIASAIYYNATNEIQHNLKWHCKHEGIELFFLKTKEGVEQSFVYDGKNLFVKENTTEKKLVDILDIIKPINRTVDENKVAHISKNRWDNFINNHSGAYLTRISIQQFLDMTTESYVDQRQINARSESISRQANVNVSDTYQEEIYLEIDFNTKKVVNHEGRHRLTSLLNQGNAFVDIFIIPTQKLNIETISNIEIEGQFNNNKYKLSVVKAESVIFKDAIYNSFRREDNNIRYSLKDSDGNTLSPEQQEYFKNSKALNKNGELQVVYHGTEGEFYTFDKALRGSMTGAKDAKLGFFFTNNKKVALEYAVNAYDNKYLNLMHKIANGDRQIIAKLGRLDGYKELAMTEDVKEFGELQDKGERFEHDIYQLYLNITNPYVEDWEGKPYKKGRMLKTITKALQSDYDGVIIKNIDDTYGQEGQISDVFVVFEPNQIKLTTNKKPTKSDDMRFSKKITANMTDSERFDILKNKKIENIPISKELTKEQLDNIQSITSFEDLNKYFGAEKRSIIKKIASEFGVFKEYYNKDIELEFEFSKSNYNESYQKQKHNFVSYAKMFSVFDAVVEKAVGIEVHNRNIKNYKEDQTLKNVYVLASAFIDDQSIVPVKLEIKEFNDKNNKLYVAIALDKIKKTEVLEDRAFLDKEVTHSSLSVNISIRDLLKNVNPNDKDFYKYIPKQFFDEDSGAIKFSKKESFIVDKYFNSQIDKWNNLKQGSYVKVGEISKENPVCLVGMPDGVLRYDVDKLRNNMTKHNDYLTIELLKQIPKIIANPVAISEYSEENTISVFGDIFVKNSPMMVGITISRDRAGNDICKIRTFNARRDVGKLITDESVLYLNSDKKRTREWFQACGIQVPLGETQFGFIRSISQHDVFVKSKITNKVPSESNAVNLSEKSADNSNKYGLPSRSEEKYFDRVNAVKSAINKTSLTKEQKKLLLEKCGY